MSRGPGLVVLKGEQYGRWRVLRGARKSSSAAWCRCACGENKHVRVSNLVYGASQSCGCLIADTSRTHGRSRTIEYRTWERMISRCYDVRGSSYVNYGGRGIRVYESWRGRGGFAQFLEHVGERPSPAHSLDRYPDRDGDYEPGNVRWATRAEQNQNTSRNVMLTFRGETRCVSEWARVVGISKKTISGRLSRGWSVRRALTTEAVPTRNYTRR